MPRRGSQIVAPGERSKPGVCIEEREGALKGRQKRASGQAVCRGGGDIPQAALRLPGAIVLPSSGGLPQATRSAGGSQLVEIARMRALCCLFLLLLALASMASGNDEGKAVPFTAVRNARLWAVGERQMYAVVTGNNWSRYYSSSPQGADFSSGIYVVACMGLQPNPGYRIRILGISQNKEQVSVSVERLGPERGKAYAQMLVTPVAVAEVRLKDLEPSRQLVFTFRDQNGGRLAEEKVES